MSQQAPRNWGPPAVPSTLGTAKPLPFTLDVRESPTRPRPACLRVPHPPGSPARTGAPAGQTSGSYGHRVALASSGPGERARPGLGGVRPGGPAEGGVAERAPPPAGRGERGPRAGAERMQTVQRQHGGEVLAVGDAGGVGNARLPQVSPIGGGGDDRAVDGGHLPVVGGQRGGHQHPARDGDQEGDDLQSRARHAAGCSRAHARTPTRRRDPRAPGPAAPLRPRPRPVPPDRQSVPGRGPPEHAPLGQRRLAGAVTVAASVLSTQLVRRPRSGGLRARALPAPASRGPSARGGWLSCRTDWQPDMDNLLRPPTPTPPQPYPWHIAWLPLDLVKAEQKKPFVCPGRTRPGNAALALLNSKGFRATLLWVTPFGLSRRDHCSSVLGNRPCPKILQLFLAPWYWESHREEVRGTGLDSRQQHMERLHRRLHYKLGLEPSSHSAGLLVLTYVSA